MTRDRYSESGVTPGIFLSTAYGFSSTAELIAFKEAELRGMATRFEYGRYGNPTLSATEDLLAGLEGGERAVLFPSGMAAVCAALTTLALQSPVGTHFILSGEGYKKTREFAKSDLQRLGIEVSFLSPEQFRNVEDFIRPETKAIFVESPTNPFLRVVDLERLVAVSRHRGVVTVVDSTFATPINQRPLEWGVDLVIHSASKYLSGHNDLIAGVVIGSGDLIQAIRHRRGVSGALPDSECAYRLYRGAREIELRMERQNRNGQLVAEALFDHPAVEQLWYPGHPSHPDYQLAREQLRGFGGVVSFCVRGTRGDTSRFIDSVRIPINAPSFGGVDALIEQPAIMSYYSFSPGEREKLGITDNLVRLSVGSGDGVSLCHDLLRALDSLSHHAEISEAGPHRLFI